MASHERGRLGAMPEVIVTDEHSEHEDETMSGRSPQLGLSFQARRSSFTYTSSHSASLSVRMSDTPDRIRAASAHLSSLFTPHSPSDVPRIATSAHLLGTSLGKAREGVAPLDTLSPMQEVDEEQMVGIGVTTAGPALSLSPPKRGSPTGPSGLSRLIAGERERSRSRAREGGAQSPIDTDRDIEVGGSSQGTIHSPPVSVPQEHTNLLTGTGARPAYGAIRSSTEETITMTDALPTSSPPSIPPKLSWKAARTLACSKFQEYSSPENIKSTLSLVITSIPAVILGMLLNVLDGVSYGMIIFPAGDIFLGFGGLGVSMFFVTTFIAQMVYTFGGSAFDGANGSMMIEVVPFFHMLTTGIVAHVGEENPKVIIATTMVAFCLSSVLTGLTFLLLGLFRLGVIIGFFPRHILVGCIGGVGIFLIETGLEVAAGINEEGGFQYNLETFKLYFMNARNLSLWLPAFGLAILLRIITHRFHHQLIFPMYFIGIGVIFYIVVAAVGVDIQSLRSGGWVFDVGGSTEPWWHFYTYFDFRQTSWSAIWAGMPTQLALLFFNILHPPLNVPALAVSLNEDSIDTNRELTAHGISNLLAGFTGTVPNYLVYVNTLLFYRVGGGTRVAGFLLACSSVLLLFIGTGPISYIPVMVVGALIFVLGLDLVKESVWDTRHRVSTSEYITIIAIMLCMSVYDFVIGVLFGIVLACKPSPTQPVFPFQVSPAPQGFFFVVQNSRRQCIRALYYGDTSMSTVRRPSAHRQFIREAACQTAILRLQGMIFFGSVTYVESTIRQLIDIANWNKRPIRFLVVDLALVGGLDMSSAEAFVRIQRLLSVKRVTLILCGVQANSPVGKALQQVDLWADRGTGVEVFGTLNEAMEWTENVYLRAWFTSLKWRKEETQSEPAPRPVERESAAKLPFVLGASYINSPRRSHLVNAGERLMAGADDGSGTASSTQEEPTAPREPTFSLLKTFSSHTNDAELMNNLAAYFTRVELQAGDVLWRQGDQPDGLYVIESGVLQANYDFAAHSAPVQESMTAGTLAGELSALSGSPRNATVVAERASVVWKLSTNDFERLEREQSDVAKAFVRLVLKAAKTDYDVLLSAHSGVNNPSRHPHFGGHFGNELRVVAHEISNGNAPVVIVLATILAKPWNGLVTKHHSQDANPAHGNPWNN
ncbi:sulfate anion transporter [Rhizoctonia solani]|uniref:Sulfate anion transporter n=1 Tax=Rhizoctonia solani TaxID=456999 RepID=A0A8H8P3G5_9AGAM|nr:sulfate anion transporter [Rhizoctonia solani]QRW22937.1 sulfate anion transporter [Rhizoctonia solani]